MLQAACVTRDFYQDHFRYAREPARAERARRYSISYNGLISELEESGNGVCLYDINMSAPTVADDMVLVSYSRAGLDNMLKICTCYANKWRFL
ncbi:hypothetical protein DPMN_085546 [Dreissena polymorpha]|uniref:Uncharacterized protein n=1 Tax=Dreissena polymorpha TaxID=45954 RepID=A0A9D4BCZ2_DREPO|nr:hypothetical protein DPMN_085546 [Dreissena polymorpha]